MDRHVDEEMIGAYVVGGTSGDTATFITQHLTGCERCRRAADTYRLIVAGLRQQPAPARVLEAAHEILGQRLRVRRFVDRLLSDASWQTEVRRDPRSALEQYRIKPTPQLVAALKELDTASETAYGNQLDERISKLLLQGL